MDVDGIGIDFGIDDNVLSSLGVSQVREGAGSAAAEPILPCCSDAEAHFAFGLLGDFVDTADEQSGAKQEVC